MELEPGALLWVYEPGSRLSTHPSILCCPSRSNFMTPRSGHLGLQLARGFFWGKVWAALWGAQDSVLVGTQL